MIRYTLVRSIQVDKIFFESQLDSIELGQSNTTIGTLSYVPNKHVQPNKWVKAELKCHCPQSNHIFTRLILFESPGTLIQEEQNMGMYDGSKIKGILTQLQWGDFFMFFSGNCTIFDWGQNYIANLKKQWIVSEINAKLIMPNCAVSFKSNQLYHNVCNGLCSQNITLTKQVIRIQKRMNLNDLVTNFYNIIARLWKFQYGFYKKSYFILYKTSDIHALKDMKHNLCEINKQCSALD